MCVEGGLLGPADYWCPAWCCVQVDEGKLSRLQDASTAKAGRLELARTKLQELQEKLTAAQVELKDLQGSAADKQKQHHSAGAEQRKIG